MHTWGWRVTDPTTADRRWISVGPGVDTRWHVAGSWDVAFEAQAGIPLKRPGFHLAPYGEVHRASPVVLRAAIGPELHFP